MDLAFCTLLLTQPFVWLLVAAAAVIQSPVTMLASLLSRRKPRSFSGRHVLITGGSEGIGLEIAKQCAARGSTVTLVARTRSKLDAARASVLAATPSAKVGVQTADVSQAAQVAQAVELGEKELGPVDVCIASAGASIPKYFEDLTHDDFVMMMNVNYFGGRPQRAPNPTPNPTPNPRLADRVPGRPATHACTPCLRQSSTSPRRCCRGWCVAARASSQR